MPPQKPHAHDHACTNCSGPMRDAIQLKQDLLDEAADITNAQQDKLAELYRTDQAAGVAMLRETADSLEAQAVQFLGNLFFMVATLDNTPNLGDRAGTVCDRALPAIITSAGLVAWVRHMLMQLGEPALFLRSAGGPETSANKPPFPPPKSDDIDPSVG